MELIAIAVAFTLWVRFVARMGEALEAPIHEDRVFDRRL